MTDSRDHRIGEGGSYVDWTRDASFSFADEVDALTTLVELGEELQLAREQARHTMRYLRAAVTATREQVAASPTAIIRHSGLSRRTVYGILGEQD